MVDVDFVPMADLRIAKTFCLSSFGHGMYLSSPSEMQKFTISTDFYDIMDSMLGNLFLEVEMPERPKESFFTGLFGGGVRNLDREELFGETSSGKGARSVAKHIPGAGGPQMDHLQMRSGTVAAEVAKTRMLMVERGDKLGKLEDKTEKMMHDAENFSSTSHQLMLKYKDKKWYQL
jgi:syntaxin-binding protein 5